MRKHDPIEQTPEYRAVEKQVDEQVHKMIGRRHHSGDCHRFWTLKKQILLRDYGIHWHPPTEINPDIPVG